MRNVCKILLVILATAPLLALAEISPDACKDTQDPEKCYGKDIDSMVKNKKGDFRTSHPYEFMGKNIESIASSPFAVVPKTRESMIPQPSSPAAAMNIPPTPTPSVQPATNQPTTPINIYR